MNAGVKIIIGLLLIAIGFGLFVESYLVSAYKTNLFGIDIPLFSYHGWLNNFIVVVTGFIPPFLILIGLFIFWLELDEMKMQKELEKEAEREKKGRKKKKEEGTEES